MKVLIYSKSITSRLEYAATLLLQHILGVEVIFTGNSLDFSNSSEVKINYSPEVLSNCLHILPSTLLFEDTVDYIDPGFNRWEKVPVLFSNFKDSEFPFDPFAAAFWMATRYEEYLPFEPDKHGRFRATESLAFREGFLDLPVVHHWAAFLREALIKYFPQFHPSSKKFTALSTIDVDNAWAYLHKGFIRTMAALARDLLLGRMKKFSERWISIRGTISDPFDSYEKYAEFHSALEIELLWFFLLGDYGKFDKNVNANNKHFRNLIRGLSSNAGIGLHPSYNSGKSIEILKKEKTRLESILGKTVTRSRQHYLKLTLPETYRRLIQIGILEDYSMGYHDQPGFRAGMCLPYPWFDLLNNKQEDLIIIPFQVMDRTFTEYLHLSADQSYEKIREIIDNTARVKGQFVSIWHNEPADLYNPEGWFEVYRKMQRYIHELL